MSEPDDLAKVQALIASIFQQKSSGRTWGKVTLEVSFQDGRPTLGRVVDDTTFKFQPDPPDSREKI